MENKTRVKKNPSLESSSKPAHLLGNSGWISWVSFQMWLTIAVTNLLILVYEATKPTIRYEMVWICVNYVTTAKPQFTGLLPLKQQHTLLYFVDSFEFYLWQMGQIGVINLSSQILFKEIRYSSTKPTWLVVLTILENMSSSMGRMTSHMGLFENRVYSQWNSHLL